MEKHHPKIYIIGLAIAMLLVAILISRTPAAGATITNDTSATTAVTGSTTTDLESRVAALEGAIDLHLEELRVHEDHILTLEDQVANLEEAVDFQFQELTAQQQHILALEALRWRHENRVFNVVTNELWERAASCRDDDDCYHGDPILIAFSTYPLRNATTTSPPSY